MTEKTVLIVDDESFFRRTAVDALNEWNPHLRAIEAADGAEALEYILGHDVDVIVTDLQMPKLDGIGLIRELMNRGIAIPLVVITAHATAEIERWAVANRAFAVLEKPIDLAQLQAVVEGLLADSERSTVCGVTLPGLCQLLQMERKTCQMRVQSANLRGRLVFRDGELSDAVHESASGNRAATDIFGWPNPTVEMDGRLPPGPPHRVSQSVSWLIMEAARLQDEGEPPPPPTGPKRLSSSTLRLVTRPVSVPPTAGKNETRLRSSGALTATRSTLIKNIDESLERLTSIEGFVAAAVVDTETGTLLGSLGVDAVPTLKEGASANAEVVRAKRKAIEALGLDDEIQDILISLNKQYHLIRPIKGSPLAFFYVILDRSKANLALARLGVAESERRVVL